jgi:hypothetical protein
VKYKSGNFLQLNRDIFNDEDLKYLSWPAKYLYVVLTELEHRFTGGEVDDHFFRTAKQIVEDSGMAYNTILKYRKELVEAGLLQIWQTHWWRDKTHTKKSEKHVTAYRLLR